jgi:transposase
MATGRRECIAMMGQRGGTQDWLLYSFNLDDHVPRDHLLRGIDRVLDLGDLHKHLAPFYSHTGRPSIDPELMIRMLIVGYCFGIRSERRLCEEVHLNLGYRWFCRLDLEDAVPDHSTFSKNRHGRFRQSDVFRHLFEGVLRRCMSEGLVGGEGFAMDASVVKADANRARGVPGSEASVLQDTSASRAVREYLDALDETNPTGDDDDADPPETRKNVSLTDPAASWTAAPGGPAFYAYSTNYLIDLEAGIIVDVEATPAHRSMEVESTKIMVERVEQRFGLKPDRLVGDTAYGTAPMLGWMVKDKGIAPHVPVWDRSDRKDGTLSSSEFEWDELAKQYRCPQGHALLSERRPFTRPRDHVTKAATIIYRASQHDCTGCPIKQQCCPNALVRQIRRSVHEDSRNVARELASTPQYKQSRRDRKKVEILFAHLKRILKLDRLRLRGLSGARDEFLLAATAQNLRRMAKRLFEGCQSAAAMPA